MSDSHGTTPWMVRNRGRRQARLRLFCFPHAGAGAAIFHRWLTAFSPAIDVCAIEPPGRLVRQRDPAPARMEELVAELDAALEPYLDLPFAMFGYSLGALTAFEWSRSIRRRQGREPECLIVAACGAPHLQARYAPISQLPPQAFLAAVEERYGPIDPALRAYPDMIALVTEILRRDLAMLEAYQHAPEWPLACPIAALGGTTDPAVTSERLLDWQAHTTQPLRVELFEGGHFFLRTRGDALGALVNELTLASIPGAISDEVARRSAQRAV